MGGVEGIREGGSGQLVRRREPCGQGGNRSGWRKDGWVGVGRRATGMDAREADAKRSRDQGVPTAALHLRQG